MLVEINLLPKKESTNSSRLALILAAAVLVAAGFLAISLQGSKYQKEMDAVDKQIESIQKLNEAQQAKLADGNADNAASRLEAAADWAEQYPFETVPLLRKIIGLLPERGFIQEFEYSSSSSVIIKIQFDASRDAAFYLSSLKQADWVESAKIHKVEAIEAEETGAETPTVLAEEEEATIMPRYLADYEITFKTAHFKENNEAVAGGGSES